MSTEADATRDALERIRENGSDMSRPMVMDFFVAVPDEPSGRAVAAKAAELGFDTSVEQDEETETWTCFCGKRMVPAYEAVRAIEQQLDALGREVGGHADEFGTFGNAEA